jgi:ferredoxin
MPRPAITFEERRWDVAMKALIKQNKLLAPVVKHDFQDYEIIGEHNLHQIIYNHPKPTTPLKTFFLPIKQNVTIPLQEERVIIMGVPACDLQALGILDEMYLDPDYPDLYYASRRRTTLLIGTDCHQILPHCHCVSYGLKPYPQLHHDILLTRLNSKVILEAASKAGEAFLQEIGQWAEGYEIVESDQEKIREIRADIEQRLAVLHADLPGYKMSGDLIEDAAEEVWQEHAFTCVSCGACATICPTCTCFLLIDRPDFEKIRQMDACQYPGFTRVAGGEDHLINLAERFKHRYMCKYVWKPKKFHSPACTGCGRCIEACIGKINKNEILTSLASVTTL